MSWDEAGSRSAVPSAVVLWLATVDLRTENKLVALVEMLNSQGHWCRPTIPIDSLDLLL